MSKTTRWLLVVTIGVMVHLMMVNTVVAKLSPFYNLPSYTSGLPPFGQVNYQTADAIAFIEWLINIILWLAFSVALLREKSE